MAKTPLKTEQELQKQDRTNQITLELAINMQQLLQLVQYRLITLDELSERTEIYIKLYNKEQETIANTTVMAVTPKEQ